MLVHRIILTALNFEDIGDLEIHYLLENQTDSLMLSVESIETREIGEWSDNHPLNHESTRQQELYKLFGGHT